jgi:small subunit ribosomal protein S1
MPEETALSEQVDATLSEQVETTKTSAPRGGASKRKLTRFERESDYSVTEYTDLMKMYESTLGEITEHEIVKGRIVQINNDEVSIDIGFKSEGVIPRNEFTNINDLKPGDEVEVYLEKVEDSDGKLILSRKRADFMRVWERIVKAFDTQDVLTAKVVRRIKGGLVVDLIGVEAFLPGSQVDVRPVRDFDALIDRELDVRIVKINHPNENVVVSHKILLEENLAGQREEILARLEKGLVLEGIVKAITDFGVFVDLGGVDGLVHITDLSWGRVNHPSEVVKLDETIQVVVLDFDEERRRISLGYKQLTPHPWESIDEKLTVGQRITGKVVSLTDYGAFIELERGIEGLIHISEMSWTQHVKHPSQMVSLGQMVEVQVLNVDKEEKKISLGMKQLEPDPWDALLQTYPVGSSHTGVVRNLANFGVFVELEPGVDGLVHISDLSWTKKLRHPGEMIKKGQDLEVMILGIDAAQRRISLGHKQVTLNPWDEFIDEYRVGQDTEGKVVRITDKGVVVELPHGVDGFVPTSQLAFAPVKSIATYFRVGDNLPLKVIEFDKDAKKIVLSVVESLKAKPIEAHEDYYRLHPVPQSAPAGMEEIIVPEISDDEAAVERLGSQEGDEIFADIADAPAEVVAEAPAEAAAEVVAEAAPVEEVAEAPAEVPAEEATATETGTADDSEEVVASDSSEDAAPTEG